MVQLHCALVIVTKNPLKTFFFSATFSPQASHQEMANPLPVVAQEDLESFTLTRTGSGFALKAFHISWNTPISVKLLTSQDSMDRYVSYLPNQPCRWAAQTCRFSTRTNRGISRITWSPSTSPFLEILTSQEATWRQFYWETSSMVFYNFLLSRA